MSLPAYLKKHKQSPLKSTHLVQMAKLCTCHNTTRASTNNNNTFVLIPAVFCAFTPMPAQTFSLTLTLASALGPPDIYINEDLQKTIKLALKLFVRGQDYDQLKANSVSQNKAFKARNSNRQYGSLHIKYYYFCLKCEDYFNTTRLLIQTKFLPLSCFSIRILSSIDSVQALLLRYTTY